MMQTIVISFRLSSGIFFSLVCSPSILVAHQFFPCGKSIHKWVQLAAPCIMSSDFRHEAKLSTLLLWHMEVSAFMYSWSSLMIRNLPSPLVMASACRLPPAPRSRQASACRLPLALGSDQSLEEEAATSVLTGSVISVSISSPPTFS